MVLTDTRFTVKDFFTPGSANLQVIAGNLTRVDGSNASYTAQYAWESATLYEQFTRLGLDLIFVFHFPPAKPIGSPSQPIGYVYTILIEAYTINKRSGNTATMKVRGDELAWQALQEIERIIRVNAVGSYRQLGAVRPTLQKIGQSPLYVVQAEVEYTQYVSAYGSYTVANRRYFNTVKQLLVGITGAVGDTSSVGESSGLSNFWVEDPDPDIEIPIPGGTPVVQSINKGLVKAGILIRDYEAVTQLFRTIDVSASGGTQVAVSGTSRTTIGYLAVVVYNTKIVNATDARTSTTSTFSFASARIGKIRQLFNGPAEPWLVEWKAPTYTQTDT